MIDTYIMQKKTKIRSASTSNNNVLGNNNNIIQQQNYSKNSSRKGTSEELKENKSNKMSTPHNHLQSTSSPVDGRPPLIPSGKKQTIVARIAKFDSAESVMPPPIDHNKTVYKIFFLQGLGMMFPWNVYITAQSYYKHRFEGTAHTSNFTFWFSTCFQIANIVGLALAVYYGSKFNMRFSVAFPMVINCLVLIATTSLVETNRVTANFLFILTCGFVATCGVCTALLQLGIFGLAGRFPNVYMQAVMSGQGMAGIAVSLINIFTTVSEPATKSNLSFDDIKESAFLYFLIATIVVIVTLLSFNLMSYLDFAQYYAFTDTQEEQNKNRRERMLAHRERKKKEKNGSVDTTPLLMKLGGPEDPNIIPPFKRSIMESPVYSRRSTPGTTPNGSPGGSRGNSPNSDYEDLEADDKDGGNKVGTCKIISYLWADAIGVFLVFFVTLSLFPGVTAEIRSVKNPDNFPAPPSGRVFGDLWVPISFLCFNVGDTLGRIMTAYVKLTTKPVLILATLRLGFLPLFLNCNVVPAGLEPKDDVMFNNDIYPIIFMALMAISNGFLASCAMMNGPENVPDNVASRAGTLMAFFLEFGLILGCTASFGLQAIVCQCNPFAFD